MSNEQSEIEQLRGQLEVYAQVVSSYQNYVPDLILFPPRECPECGDECGDHHPGCKFPLMLKQREDDAKAILDQFSPQQVDDLLSLLTARSGDSLGGSLFRCMIQMIQQLEHMKHDLESAIRSIDSVVGQAKQDLDKIEEHWCRR